MGRDEETGFQVEQRNVTTEPPAGRTLIPLTFRGVVPLFPRSGNKSGQLMCYKNRKLPTGEQI
jgi:hypothetical protein